ncbi:hypothetical protein CR513_51710, partial [Mucuna pruriens]
MVLILHKMYLKDTNHHLHLDNNSICNLYNSFPDHSQSINKCECHNLEEWQGATTTVDNIQNC